MNEEIQKIINELRNEISELKSELEDFKLHTHDGFDSNNINFRDLLSVSGKLDIPDGTKLYFGGTTTQYEIYRVEGDNGELRIDAVNDYSNEVIKIGGSKKPVSAYVYGGDEGLIGANNNTNNSYLLMEPDKGGIFTDKGNDFYFRLPNGSANPSATITGALAVVNGKLKIYNGTSWVVVGTQT